MTSAEALSSARADRDAMRMRRDVQTSARMARPPRPDLPAPARESMVPVTAVSDVFVMDADQGAEEGGMTASGSTDTQVVFEGDGVEESSKGNASPVPSATAPGSSSVDDPKAYTRLHTSKPSLAHPTSRQAAQRMMHHFALAEADLYRHLTPTERARLRRSTCTPTNAWWARMAYSDPETWLVLALLVGAVLALALTASTSSCAPAPQRGTRVSPLSYYRRGATPVSSSPHSGLPPQHHDTGVVRRHATLAAEKLAAYAGTSRKP